MTYDGYHHDGVNFRGASRSGPGGAFISDPVTTKVVHRHTPQIDINSLPQLVNQDEINAAMPPAARYDTFASPYSNTASFKMHDHGNMGQASRMDDIHAGTSYKMGFQSKPPTPTPIYSGMADRRNETVGLF